MKTDDELVLEALKGNMDSFEELVSKYEKLIYSIAFRMINNSEDAKDISQIVLMKIYKNMKNAIGKGNFKSWICTIASNTSIDEIRKKNKKSTLSIDNNIDCPEGQIQREFIDKDLLPLDKIVFQEENSILEKAISSLDLETKRLIILRDIEGFSYEDIGKIANLKIGTVKSRISRSRKKLQQNYLLLMEQYNT